MQNIDYLCQKSSNTCQKHPGMSFSQNKKNQRQKSSRNWMLEKNAGASWFGTRKPQFCNIHTYHFHVLESPHLNFSICLGCGGGINWLMRNPGFYPPELIMTCRVFYQKQRVLPCLTHPLSPLLQFKAWEAKRGNANRLCVMLFAIKVNTVFVQFLQ